MDQLGPLSPVKLRGLIDRLRVDHYRVPETRRFSARTIMADIWRICLDDHPIILGKAQQMLVKGRLLMDLLPKGRSKRLNMYLVRFRNNVNNVALIYPLAEPGEVVGDTEIWIQG